MVRVGMGDSCGRVEVREVLARRAKLVGRSQLGTKLHQLTEEAWVGADNPAYTPPIVMSIVVGPAVRPPEVGNGQGGGGRDREMGRRRTQAHTGRGHLY